jgi:hypothetical protein
MGGTFRIDKMNEIAAAMQMAQSAILNTGQCGS